MKRYIILLWIVPFLALASFTAPKALIEWDFTEYDFGSIEKDNPVSTDFEFKNTGMVPLVILDVESSCGCTVPSQPQEPIMPGKTGKITVEFDAKDSGHFSKEVKVFSNTEDGVTLLYIKGEVVK